MQWGGQIWVNFPLGTFGSVAPLRASKFSSVKWKRWQPACRIYRGSDGVLVVRNGKSPSREGNMRDP